MRLFLQFNVLFFFLKFYRIKLEQLRAWQLQVTLQECFLTFFQKVAWLVHRKQVALAQLPKVIWFAFSGHLVVHRSGWVERRERSFVVLRERVCARHVLHTVLVAFAIFALRCLFFLLLIPNLLIFRMVQCKTYLCQTLYLILNKTKS